MIPYTQEAAALDQQPEAAPQRALVDQLTAHPEPLRPNEIRRARFEQIAILYHAARITIAGALIFFVLGIAAAIPTYGVGLVLWLVPIASFFVARWYYTIYFKRLECTLAERNLFVGRGILFRKESAVPLDRITDMSMKQGPLLRFLKLEAMGVETAGHSRGADTGALVQLVGIHNSREFRAAVLEQRDLVVGSAAGAVAAAAVPPPPARATAAQPSPRTDELLEEIRDTLVRIESRLLRTEAADGPPPS